MKFRFIPLLFICFSFADCLAQDGLVWMRFFDPDSGGNWEQFYDVYVTEDNDYVTVGYSNGFIVALKYDADGDVIWSQIYGDGGYDVGRSVIECDNGDFVIGGWLAENARTANFMGMRISEDGEVIWMIDYGVGSCNAVIELKDGRFAFAGKLGDDSAGIIIINGDGEEIIRRAYPHGASSSFRAIRETGEGIVGLCQWYGGRTWMTEVDFDLDTLWVQDYDFLNARSVGVRLNSLVSTNDGYAFCVTVVEGQGGIYKPEILTTDPNGQLIWRQRYNLENEPYETTSIFSLGQQGLLVAGGQIVASLMNVDNRGDPQWQSSYYTERNEDYEARWFESVTLDRNGDIIACGLGINRNYRRGCGMIAKIDGLQLQPLILEWSPRDSMLTAVPGDSIEFAIHAQVRNDEEELRIAYWLQDTLFAEEDTITVPFDSPGVFLVEGRVFYEESITSIRWHVTVTDLYVSAYSPDSLNLSLRRGDSVDFALDTVRATEGIGDVEYQWTKSFLDDPGQPPEDAGRDASVTIPFLQSGNYAVEGLAYRGEASDAVTWNVSVKGVVWSFVPEDLALEVLPDSLIRFEVFPSNPEDSTLSARWFVDEEFAAEDTTSLDWGFFYPVHSVHNIYCVLADSIEADTVSWTVTVRDLGVKDKRDAYPTRSAALLSVSPNPFNSTLAIRYQSVKSIKSVVNIYDLYGREVFSAVTRRGVTEDKGKTVTGRAVTAERTLTWDAYNIPAGVYFVRLQSGTEVATKKVVLIR